MNNLLLNQVPKMIDPNIQKIKDIQKMKEYERNNIIRDIIFAPETVVKNNNDYNDILNAKIKEYKNIENYWKGRTNQPYKNILKNEDYSKIIKNENDLIIHKVTSNDKIGIKEKYTEIKKNIEQHNNELKVLYSTSEEAQHKKKFEYNHRYRDRKKYNPSTFNELKKEKETENIKVQKIVVDKENIVNHLVSNGIFNEDELKMFGVQ